ncbi:hypothetical protein ACFXPI_11315 [Streptomyces sp. NPDC059104]|uniref:hypothetical protein n=1 Tax=Streptomyces sp. NPDC059104 TaxID=3346729 RepID=UPI0036B338C9
MISIAQGDWCIAEPGETVHCDNMTSCGLVLAFTDNDKVACYHWPFMAGEYVRAFDQIADSLRSEGGNITLIQVFTNDFPNEQSRAAYMATVRGLASSYGGALTEYFIHPGEIRGQDAIVTLARDGAQSLHPVEQIM